MSPLARSGTGKFTITPFLLTSPEKRAGPQPPMPSQSGSSPSSTQESRPSSQPSPDLSRQPSARSARPSSSSSLLPSFRLPGRTSDCDRAMRSSRPRESRPSPKPLLILRLSSSSFLDTIIRDDKSKDPLYILETSNDITSIHRLDHARDEPIKAATIQWPIHPVRVKGKSGRSVQFGHGSWRDAEDVLKSGPLGNTAIRKFNLPHYPHSLKWKLIPGNCFCCVTNAVKGPLAVLDAATLSAAPRLKIYHTLIEREVARSQDNYKGVPTILIDYLAVTALLLVTDVQEWLDRPRESRIPGSNAYQVQRWLALIHQTPIPPEPDHPTVDLSLTVPSTPLHSATIPSPGGFWETQSGITSLSGSGSNGSGSGASYIGEPFTPTTPATPATPATSTSSSAFFSQSVEETPPVPPVPSISSGSSPFAYNIDPTRIRKRPKSSPQAVSHSSHSSTSTTQDLSHSQTDVEDEPPSPDRTHPPQSSLSPGTPGTSSTSPSTSYDASYATSAGPSSTASPSSSRPMRRLPIPPGPAPPHSFAQPWLYATSPSSTATTPSPTSPSSSTMQTFSVGVGTISASRAARASMRGSIRTTQIPPPPPPPQHSIPLPPKLAQEQAGYPSRRPRTAPERDASGRRRYSAGTFGEYVASGDVSSSVHPYAAAADPGHSSRGGDLGDPDVRHLIGQMRRLGTSPGPSNMNGVGSRTSHMGHVRAPSQPAPDYDAHSFVNAPPPLPAPPVSGMIGVRPPTGRRMLTVVNGDANTMSSEACIPSGDVLMRGRISYAESVYEAPPPAYDAIDFSVPSLAQQPSLRTQASQPLQPPLIPLPVPPIEGGEGHRES